MRRRSRTREPAGPAFSSSQRAPGEHARQSWNCQTTATRRQTASGAPSRLGIGWNPKGPRDARAVTTLNLEHHRARLFARPASALDRRRTDARGAGRGTVRARGRQRGEAKERCEFYTGIGAGTLACALACAGAPNNENTDKSGTPPEPQSASSQCPDAGVGTIGAQDGDSLERINGFDVADPDAAWKRSAACAWPRSSRFSSSVAAAPRPSTSISSDGEWLVGSTRAWRRVQVLPDRRNGTCPSWRTCCVSGPGRTRIAAHRLSNHAS